MNLVLWLLSLALSHHGAGGFLLQLARECHLADDGSILQYNFDFVFNKNRLVCYNDSTGHFEACDTGVLNPLSEQITHLLNHDASWLQRMAEGRQACQTQSQQLWAQTGQRMKPPSIRIVSITLLNPAGTVQLTCHVWGFYPEAVLVTWLQNGHPVGPHGDTLTAALANGDWTYQTRVTLTVTPQPGDTYTCVVQHPSQAQPYLEEWRPGLSPGLTIKVSMAVVVLVLGLIFLTTGMVCWRRAPAPGYSRLTGHNYPGGST